MEYAGLKLCLRLQGLHVFLPWFNQSLVLFLSSSRLGAEGPTFKITRTGGASDIVKAESSGEDPRATGGLVSNLPHPRVNKTKQHFNKTKQHTLALFKLLESISI